MLLQLAYWYLLVAPGDGCWGRPWGTGCAAFHHVLRYVRAGDAAELASPCGQASSPERVRALARVWGRWWAGAGRAPTSPARGAGVVCALR